MKCLIVLVLYFASLFSNVYSLGLDVVSMDGYKAVVQWTREDFDPDPLTFDLRFVIPPYYDVGLAQANLSPSELKSSGNVSIEFPGAGTYMVVAVSGQDDINIGRTTAMEISGGSTSPLSPTPSPTSSQMPSPTVSQMPSPTTSQMPSPMSSQMPSETSSISPSPSKSIPMTESSSLPKQKPNVAAIVCATIGGVSLLALILLAVFHFHKRRPPPDTRVSFHGERMVQQSPHDGRNPSIRKVGQGGVVIPYPFTGPGSNFGSALPSSREAPRLPPLDVEQGLAVPPPAVAYPSRPSSPSGHIVPSPRGPRNRGKSIKFNVSSPRATRVDGEPTARQLRLAGKLAEVDKQIEELKSQSKPPPSTIVLLDDLEIQRTWLAKQRDSMWAMGEIDLLPPGYTRYMTKLG